MDWLAKYWWILVIVFLVGVLLNVIKTTSAKNSGADQLPISPLPGLSRHRGKAVTTVAQVYRALEQQNGRCFMANSLC